MDTKLIEHVETSVERAASALLGVSVGFAAFRLLGGMVHGPQLAAICAGMGLLLSLACMLALGSMAPRRNRFSVGSFPLAEFDPAVADEPMFADVDRAHVDVLVLTSADRVQAGELILSDADRLRADELILLDEDRLASAPSPRSEPPLMLDDILAELGPNSRVVRLFDRKAMPTAGQLKSRIDHHLGQETGRGRMPDASEALSEALAELRRSLR